MANVWMHNGFLQVEGRKMSKSEGNFFTIHELMHTENFGGRKWPGEVLRLAMLMTHYREPIDFSQRRLEEAEVLLERWVRAAKTPVEQAAIGDPETVSRVGFDGAIAALADDLNTPAVIPIMQALSKSALTGYAPALDSLREIAALIGFDLAAFGNLDSATDIDAREIENSIQERLAFIREKNWAEADRIRDELLSEGIQLKDSRDSKTGERITTWEVKR
jgi:cysteinyl-tRNA synthetase